MSDGKKTPPDARLPNDLHLERDVIASCLLRPEVITTIGVSEEDFALPAHRLVWRAMCDVHEVGDVVDLVRIRSKLTDWDDLNAVGGESFLATFRGAVPSKALPLDRLHRMTRLRKLRAQAEAVIEAASGNNADMASAALEEANRYDSDAVSIRPMTLRELADEWYAGLGRDDKEGTVSPGLPALKRVIGRLDEGSFTLIGADTNVGKSTAALEMIAGALLDEEKCGYLSMEDPKRVVTERLIGMFGNMSPKRVRRFKPGDHDEVRVDRAMDVMTALDDRVMVSQCIGMNEREALEQMTMMTKSGCRLIVLDYIGVVGSSVKQQDRRNEIRWIATRFKARTAGTKVALVVVSQLQRPKDGDSGKKPGKHAFREAGDLEAMAEYAIVMWRKVEDDFAPVYCELVKSKTGGVGYGWTMQRQIRGPNGEPGSGRLMEAAHSEETIRDIDGNVIDVPLVAADPSGQERWSIQRTSR